MVLINERIQNDSTQFSCSTPLQGRQLSAVIFSEQIIKKSTVVPKEWTDKNIISKIRVFCCPEQMDHPLNKRPHTDRVKPFHSTQKQLEQLFFLFSAFEEEKLRRVL